MQVHVIIIIIIIFIASTTIRKTTYNTDRIQLIELTKGEAKKQSLSSGLRPRGYNSHYSIDFTYYAVNTNKRKKRLCEINSTFNIQHIY
jgi:hypothetical protein